MTIRQFSTENTLGTAASIVVDAGGSAWVERVDARCGSLEVGKLADLVVLNKDYLTVSVEQIGGIKSQLTLLGRWVQFLWGFSFACKLRFK